MLKLRSWLSSVYLSLPPLLSQLYSNISALLLFLFFSSVIVYMFYNRLIREHLPRDLLEPVSSFQEYIYMYILGVNIIILILLLWGRYQEYIDEAYEELGVEREVNKKSLWYLLKNKLTQYIESIYFSLTKTYLDIIYPAWQDEYHRLLIACFIQFNNLSPLVKLIYFYGILIIPKVIVASIFIWEVLIKNELNLFYRVLWLLLCPLIFKFIRYNYTIIHDFTMDHIREEMDNDPHAFRGTREDLDNILANLSEEDLTQASSRAQEFWEQKEAAWYKRVFYSLKEFISDLQEKTGVALYHYHVRVNNLLSYLPLTIQNCDLVQKKIKLILNLILRLVYILGFSVILLKIIQK